MKNRWLMFDIWIYYVPYKADLNQNRFSMNYPKLKRV